MYELKHLLQVTEYEQPLICFSTIENNGASSFGQHSLFLFLFKPADDNSDFLADGCSISMEPLAPQLQENFKLKCW